MATSSFFCGCLFLLSSTHLALEAHDTTAPLLADFISFFVI
jgi:hypothetical protein